MTKPFNELRKKMSPASRARAETLTKQMLAEMPLHQLRQAMNLTQEELASTLNVKQATVSKLERRDDMYISTLARFVEAVGGELEVRARFPNGDVKINGLEGLSKGVPFTFDSRVQIEPSDTAQLTNWTISGVPTHNMFVRQKPRPALSLRDPTATESIATPQSIMGQAA